MGACIVGAGFSLFSGMNVCAQEQLLDKAITLPKQKTTLYQALNLVSQKADCYFIYDSETLENDKNVKLEGGRHALKQVLDDLLSDPGLRYKVLGKHILIYRAKSQSPPPAVVQTPGNEKDTTKTIIIRGHLYDYETRAAIPFATIGIVEENVGTVTNNDGFFSLKIPASRAGSSLVVSHLGYVSQRIPVRLLDEQTVDLYLERKVISIQEVIIRYIDPVQILEKAMDQRDRNDAVEPVYLTAFYREGVEKNNRYINYSEAVFKVFKTPYHAGEHTDQVKLLKSRKVQEDDPRDTVYLKLKAGVQSALELDLVKCVPGFLDMRPPNDYTYQYSNLVSYDSTLAYAISFVQNSGLREALFTGTVYVEKENFAILGAEFEITPEYLDMAARDLILKKSLNVKVVFEKIHYSVTYRPYHGRYYLSHVRCDIRLKTRLRNRLSYDHFNTFLELVTCSIDTTAVERFSRQETLKPGVVFSDQPFNGKDEFWRGYNIIAPEEKVNEALSKIIGKIEEIGQDDPGQGLPNQ